MTEGRRTSDADFEWTDAPVRPRRPDSGAGAFNTGERDSFKPQPRTPPAEAGESGPDATRKRGRRIRLRSLRFRPLPEALRAPQRPRRRPPRRPRPPQAPPPKRRPTGERVRRKDLPARVRRRQDVAVGFALALAAGAAIVLLTGGGGTTGGGVAVAKLAGQTIVGKMGPGGPDKRMLRQVRAGHIGSLIVLPHDAVSLSADVGRVQKAARAGGNPPLLIMISQEGGYVKRLPGPPDVSPNDLGRSGSAASARAEGQRTASYLAGFGVNVNLAPLLDVTTGQTADTVATRTYGSDPSKVAQIGIGFIQGLQAGGVAATAKHFPGLGLSNVDTDFGASTVQASSAQQEAAIAPFKQAVDAGVDLVMTSTAVFPNLDPQNPAALSSKIVTGQLRDALHFKGPIITDDLEARSITDAMAPERAAIAALSAGDDLLLFAHRVGTADSAFRAVVKASRAGQIDRSTLQAAYDRVLALKRSLSSAP